ncbi:hypothetical protein EW146_g4835 [Bondarzewia mesenterica]|uniref:Uncharacterized protein n=1 Tax=Bondarzewia mesenterica TaxID=1095465 RepID=A0A4S4LTC8_9AGAM|nr:hypothetical protein EW146_g4835 [Bondarzewia mesenterica]
MIIEDYITAESFEIIARPSLSAYITKDEPLTLLKEQLERKSTWGLPKLRDDMVKWRAIVEKARKKLNDRRYELKKAITDSIPHLSNPKDATSTKTKAQDILILCRIIRKNSGQKEPSIEMLTCVAFLRHCLCEYERNKRVLDAKDFWNHVDAELAKIREMHNDNAVKISKVFKQILENDQTEYGRIDTEGVALTR